MVGRRGIRRKQLLDDLKQKRGYRKLKEEALDCAVCRTRFGRGYGPVVRQNIKWWYVIKIRQTTENVLVLMMMMMSG
jgi:hypothetical protein